MGDVCVIPPVDQGLGHSGYLVDLDDGRVLAVAVSRNPRAVGAVPVLRCLARLEDDVAVWPTHSAGSFCSAPAGAERTSTMGAERATNMLLRTESEDVFVEQLLGSLGNFPPYFFRLSEINRRGSDGLARLTAVEVARLRAPGAGVVDVRPVANFGAGHVPGSVFIPLPPVFAIWLGRLVDGGKPIGLRSDRRRAEGGVGSWRASGRPTTSIPNVTPREVGDTPVLDTRQDNELVAGHLPAARHVELGALTAEASKVPAGPTVVMCGHSERAMGAASLPARARRIDVLVLDGSLQDWADATGEYREVGA